MGIIELILMLAILGLVTWIILQIPMPAVIRNVIVAVVAIFIIVWLLQNLGLLGSMRVK